ncbi:hypothetical protein F2Q69_00005538 [Brassica cretica]|uniref:Uncharacterized protein n=1 Tax=Brassica cretica TaxID=69181 RepID=A0A8S9NQZ5_BRACR|nr:hypothetical protein F2Q69_00005538 [Brassica cretica]
MLDCFVQKGINLCLVLQSILNGQSQSIFAWYCKVSSMAKAFKFFDLMLKCLNRFSREGAFLMKGMTKGMIIGSGRYGGGAFRGSLIVVVKTLLSHD